MGNGESDAPVRGRAETPGDEGLDAAIKDLAPHLALARVDSLGRFIFGNVAVIGTLLGALGLVASTQARPAPTEVLGVPLVVLLVGISLLFALVAITPWLFKLNLDNRSDVRASFSTRIKLRGSAAMVAAVLFAGAIVATLAETTRVGATVSLSGGVSGTGADAKATMTAEATGVPSGGKATATLTKLTGGKAGTILCSSEATGDATGKATMSCTVEKAGELKALRATVSVVDNEDVLTTQRLDVMR